MDKSIDIVKLLLKHGTFYVNNDLKSDFDLDVAFEGKSHTERYIEYLVNLGNNILKMFPLINEDINDCLYLDSINYERNIRLLTEIVSDVSRFDALPVLLNSYESLESLSDEAKTEHEKEQITNAKNEIMQKLKHFEELHFDVYNHYHDYLLDAKNLPIFDSEKQATISERLYKLEEINASLPPKPSILESKRHANIVAGH